MNPHRDLSRLEESFARHFEHWQIFLPVDDCQHRRAGSIHRKGWTINYQFGHQGEREFIDYFATHRMTNDRLVRIWEDGTTESLGYCQPFYTAGDEEARQAYLEHNRRFYQMVEEKGLWQPSK